MTMQAGRASNLNPGQYQLSNGQIVNIQAAYRGYLYDTVFIAAAGPVAANLAGRAPDTFFDNIQGKSMVDCNLRTPSRLPAGQAMEVESIGVYIPKSFGIYRWGVEDAALNLTPDEQLILENGFLEVKFGERIICQGPLVLFPSGFGVAGSLAPVAAPGVNAIGASLVTNGTPATKLQHDLVDPETLTENTMITASISWLPRAWAVAAAVQPQLIGIGSIKLILMGTRLYGLS